MCNALDKLESILEDLVENGWQFQMSTKYLLYDEASMF